MATSRCISRPRQGPLEVVSALLQAFPDAAKEKNNYGGLALHFAAENKALGGRVGAATGVPDAAKKNEIGMLPLFRGLATSPFGGRVGAAAGVPRRRQGEGQVRQARAARGREQAPLEVVSALQAFPDGAKEKGCNDKLALHYATENKAPLEVVSALPGVPRRRPGEGQVRTLALHFAAWKQAPLEVVSALLQAFPDGIKGKAGRLVLHFAAENQAPWRSCRRCCRLPRCRQGEGQRRLASVRSREQGPLGGRVGAAAGVPRRRQGEEDGKLALHFAAARPWRSCRRCCRPSPTPPRRRTRTASSRCISRRAARPPWRSCRRCNRRSPTLPRRRTLRQAALHYATENKAPLSRVSAAAGVPDAAKEKDKMVGSRYISRPETSPLGGRVGAAAGVPRRRQGEGLQR